MRIGSLIPLLFLLVCEQAMATDEAFLMEPVVVTPARGPGALFDLAGNTARIASSELELISAPHVNEVAARIPGMWLTRSAGTAGHLTAIRSPALNGPGACGEFLFMEEGIPVSGRGFCNVNELFSINTEQAGAILAATLLLFTELRRPLLVEGDAGVGKTEIAKALAVLFGSHARTGQCLLRFQCAARPGQCLQQAAFAHAGISSRFGSG